MTLCEDVFSQCTIESSAVLCYFTKYRDVRQIFENRMS